MKNTSKFLAVMLAITGLFCCAVAVGIGAGFNAVRESTDKKIIAVAEKVKEKYPDISEKELAQILNNDTAGIKGDFAKYGIKSDSGWVDIQRKLCNDYNCDCNRRCLCVRNFALRCVHKILQNAEATAT